MFVASVSVHHFLYSTFKMSQVQAAVVQPYALGDVTENAESDVSGGSLTFNVMSVAPFVGESLLMGYKQQNPKYILSDIHKCS